MVRKLSNRRGLAGWVILALVLAFAVMVGVFITLTHRDKDRERDRAAEYVTDMLAVDTLSAVPKVETEVVYDYGERVLIAARYKIEVEGQETISGSRLLDISDLSQQVYDVSEEYPYDYDYASIAHIFARQWGII